MGKGRGGGEGECRQISKGPLAAYIAKDGNIAIKHLYILNVKRQRRGEGCPVDGVSVPGETTFAACYQCFMQQGVPTCYKLRLSPKADGCWTAGEGRSGADG